MKDANIDVKDLFKKKDFLVGAVVVILALVVANKVYTDKNNQIKRIKASIQEENKKNDLHSQVGALEEQLKKYSEQATLSQTDRTALLDNISSIAAKHGLKIVSISFSDEDVRDFYSLVPVELTLTGNYHNFGLFVSEIESLEQFLKVTEVQFGSQFKEGKKTKAQKIEAVISAVVMKEKNE